MNSFDFDPHDIGTMSAGDDDSPAPDEPTPKPGDVSFRLALAFLNMLDRARNHWEFRTFDDVVMPDGSKRKDPKLTTTIRGSLKQALPKLRRMNELGAGVFVTINRTDGEGRTAENVTDVRAFFADTDGADVQPLLALKPHIAVKSSPGKWHIYWIVGDCELSQFKPIQSAIAENFGTDKNVCDLPRVMRVPGFSHNKHEPFSITFAPEFMDPKREPYSVQEVVEGLNLQLHVSKGETTNTPTFLGEAPEYLGERELGNNTAFTGPPPPAETMRAMLSHLAALGAFAERKEDENDAEGRLIKVGWIKCGMALKVAYGDEAGFDLWGVTHIDERARSDAPGQWSSFASEAQAGQVTIGTIIKAAKDSGFAFGPAIQSASAAPSKTATAVSSYVSYYPFTMDADDGLTKEIAVGSGKSRHVETAWISAPFEILGACRDPRGRSWGKLVRFHDADNRMHDRHISDSALQGDPATLCAALADEGLKINRSKQRELAEYMSGLSVQERVTIVKRTGWHDIGGQSMFVLPVETIAVGRSERVVLDQIANGPYEARGSLEDWKQGVGSLTAGHALPVFMVSAALAGPLLHLVGAEGGGVHVFGNTSIGKSAILEAAASVWGRGGTPGYVRSWRATANGLEGEAASATDTCMVLDEIGLAEARDVAASIYSLANGQGKARAARDGSLRNPKSWRVSVLSSGEVPLETKLGEDRGRKARAGQLVRVLDIPADRGLGFGAFDRPGGFADAGKLADAIKSAAVTAYGTAGPEFIRRITAKGVEKFADAGNKFIGWFVDRVVEPGASEQVVRAAKKFALIAFAGELATLLAVTPWRKGEAREAAKEAFNRWVEKRGGAGSHEERQAIDQVRLMIEQHGESRFERVEDYARAGTDVSESTVIDEGRVRDRLGWRKGDGPAREWFVPPETWKAEVCAGLDHTYVARTLDKHGMLRRQDAKNLTCVVKLGGRQTRAYVLTAVVLDSGP
jgi:uncharacterized protein (DUF927 family)